MKIKRHFIFHQIEDIGGMEVHFVRVAKNLGWYTVIGKERFGDWVILSESDTHDQVQFTIDVFRQQAAEAIKTVLTKK